MTTMNIIGAGQVGQTLGCLLVSTQQVTLLGVVNSVKASAAAAIGYIGQGVAYATIETLPHADLTLIATPDNEIVEVATRLAKSAQLQAEDVVFHCSGALSSDALAVLSPLAVKVASVHPMMSFKQVSLSIEQYHNVPCALEGDKAAVQKLMPLLTSIGSLVYEIDKDYKPLYHVAGVLASNYVVTLAQHAQACLLAAGLEVTQADQVLRRVLESTCHNILHASQPKMALTGPLQRGDSETITKHLQILPESLQGLYRILAMSTLPLTTLDKEQQHALVTLLSQSPFVAA
jgi:predicted short-subunit dehydrogenase-like oxidoreductase (DUF2520 family)